MSMAAPHEQQAYMAKVDSRIQSQIPPQNEHLQDVANAREPAPMGKKRLNQAQRRQKNAELSIPINPRSNTTAQPGRGNTFAGTSPSPHYSQLQHSRNQAQYNQGYPNQPQQSPRYPFPNTGQPSPYSPRGPQWQGYPQSPMHHPHQGPTHHYQSQSGYSPQYQQQFSPGVGNNPYGRPPPQNRQLYQPGAPIGQNRPRPLGFTTDEIASQSAHLEKLVLESASTVGIDAVEEAEKEGFRALVENACREAIEQYEKDELGHINFDSSTVKLKCFGSMSSGFATKASDMDLALLTPESSPAADTPESLIPRILEKKLLDMGFGARLLTRTRVPIIKLCQKPTSKLFSDLVVERTKWENGFVDEEEEVALLSKNIQKINTPKIELSLSPEPSPAAEPTQKVDKKQDELSKLRQPEGQSLGDYYGRAKRVLRSIGGRDVSVGLPTFTQDEGLLMNEVCKAFISGLASEALAARMRSYQSIAPLFDASMPYIQRSINGVYTQVEGERLAMNFEKRPLTEREERREHECKSLIETWRAFQNNAERSFLEPLLSYNRCLYLAAEKLKNISSLQLMLFEQLSNEDPVSYHRRAQKILGDLKGRKSPRDHDTVTPVVITHYINGINNPMIKEAMQTCTQDQNSLDKVVFHHRILQLAADYEHALSKGHFDHAVYSEVEKYVVLLRKRVANGPTLATESDKTLIALILTLPDPTTISQAKPRDRYKDHLEFPKTNIGVQCDINFSADLALHNTLLMRCYSSSDPRVKPLILFVKQWAKSRGINSSYRGTLSSYGYVLMVLHYLVNIVQPFVCPNLQSISRDAPPHLQPAEAAARSFCKGKDVRFWQNEAEIKDLSARGLLNHNHDSVGSLIRGFFEYYAHGGTLSTVQNIRGFDWGRDVLSLRTQGGILTKQEKGWVGAKTVIETSTVAAPPTPSTPASSKDQIDGHGAVSPEGEPLEVKHAKPKTIEETKEIRHRYLFAIEDPFELEHNVARTVTHNGIVSIRDEFRRAWGIIRTCDKENQNISILVEPVVAPENDGGFQQLLNLIHGTEVIRGSYSASSIMA